MILPAIFAVVKFQIPLSWLPLGDFGKSDRPAMPPISAAISDTINLRNLFYFHEVSTKISILAVEAKSLIFLWRVFAESAHTRRSYGTPVARHVSLVARHRCSNVPAMSRLCPGQTR